MYQKSNIKINLTGGLTSPSQLLKILEIAGKTSVKSISIGARQQLLLTMPPRQIETFAREMREAALAFETDMEACPNIASSFAFADILQYAEGRVSEGMYLDIFSAFDYKPALKINICDSSQSHAPFFTGHLNFISSGVPHFWFCHVRFPKSNVVECFPKLIYSQDIASFARQLEYFLLKNQAAASHSSLLAAFEAEGVIFRQIENELNIPRFVLPYYEGLNRQPDGNLWLGIYRRNEDFPLDFLKELCLLCDETRIGNICLTHWRSLVVKGISKEDRLKWEKLLGKHGINVRHAHNELNWQTEDDSPTGFRLRQYLVKQFDAMDVRTFGLVFGIKTRPKSEVFGSVFIRRKPALKIGRLELAAVYDIFYAEDFNPHNRRRKAFLSDLPKSRLAEELLILSKKYYRELSGDSPATKLQARLEQFLEKPAQLHYRCARCWTTLGETNLPGSSSPSDDDRLNDYACPVCEADKLALEAVILPT